MAGNGTEAAGGPISLYASQFFRQTAMALVCLLAAVPEGARADNLFSVLFAPTPRPAKAIATASGWTATVFHTLEIVPAARKAAVPETRVVAAPEARGGDLPVAARDTDWTVTVVAFNGQQELTTGSIARHEAEATRPGPRLTGRGHALSGVASYYWEDQKTATGEQFNKRAMTAAHKTLPFGTRVRVTRVDNGDSVVVRINDRGPYVGGRIIDLSERAAETLGMKDKGTTPVRVEVLGQ